jgi:hypothetical protein
LVAKSGIQIEKQGGEMKREAKFIIYGDKWRE